MRRPTPSYTNYTIQIYVITHQIFGSDDLAEDIVQHTMIKIWKKGLDLNVNTSLKGYLYKSIYNHFIDLQRKTKKEISKLERLKQEVYWILSNFQSKKLRIYTSRSI
jgi:RNA polymerase sigma-70 factor (ECF subfamily)